MLVRNRFEVIPSWTATLPIIFEAANSPLLVEHSEAISAGTLNAEREEVPGLEDYRAALDSYFAVLQEDPSLDSERLTIARDRVQLARHGELLVAQEVLGRASGAASPTQIIDLYDALHKLGPDGLTGLQDFNFNCTFDVLGATVNLNFICNPIEDVLNFLDDAINAVGDFVQTVFDAVLALPDILLQGIQDLFAFLAEQQSGVM